jgi:hypothetical protein
MTKETDDMVAEFHHITNPSASTLHKNPDHMDHNIPEEIEVSLDLLSHGATTCDLLDVSQRLAFA